MTTRIHPQQIIWEDVEQAIAQLRQSGRGMRAMHILLDWLDAVGVGLDLKNQEAVVTLLRATWGPFTMSARDAMRETIEAAGEQP